METKKRVARDEGKDAYLEDATDAVHKRPKFESADDLPSVLLIGDQKLRKVSVDVEDVKDAQFLAEKKQLELVLEKFRKDNGFGRAISAPQIGVNKRFIALNLGDGPFCMINPVITYRSKETFTMWDDCMSFPWLLVKVRRHTHISVDYIDEDGAKVQMNDIEQSVSELLQHEIDHLDGILAVDIGIDKESLICRAAYDKDPEYFSKQVDYMIQPTIANNGTSEEHQ